MSNNNPSVDPANLGTLKGAFRHIVHKIAQDHNTALPVEVRGTDGQYVSVQPLIATLGTNGELTSRGQIARVPIVKIGGGGYLFNVPIQAGDQGFLIACDRDISLFLQTGKESGPNTTRIKDFADGFFIPCVFSGYTIAEEDLSSAVIQSFDGSAKVAISEELITVQGPNIDIIATETTTVTSPVVNVNVSGTLNLNIAGFGFTGDAPRIIIDSPVPVQINNSLYVQGEIIATGSISPDTPIPPLP